MRAASHAAAMTPLPHHRYLLSRLQREWNVLRGRRSVLQRASAWNITPGSLSSLDELLVATGLGSNPTDGSSDEALRRLVMIARDDDLAARVVLQRMLPGLSASAKRFSSSFGGQLEALDELLSEAWSVIRSFPIERRDRYVIKNLLRDCEYHAFLKARRRLLVHELTDPTTFDWSLAAPEAAAEPLAVIIELLQRARAAGMSDDDFALATALLSNRTVKQAADQLQVTDRTVRNRRQALVRQLRALADVA